MADIPWAGGIDAGPGGPGPSFYFPLPLTDLDDAQTRSVLDSARRVVETYASTERTVVLTAYRGIEQAARRRLAGSHEPNVFLVRATPDSTDPVQQMEDDAGTAIAHALEFANDPDAKVAAVWRSVAGGFAWTQFRMRVKLE